MRKITLVEVLVIIIILILTIILLITTSKNMQSISYNAKCSSNLNMIGRAMILYTMDFRRGVQYPRLYPRLNGSGFLATLYRENILIELSIYLCPGTFEDNREMDLGAITDEGDGYGPISYAGRKNKKQVEKLYPSIFQPNKDTATTTIAADDWNDGKEENHYNGKIVHFLFLDGHSEYRMSRSADFNNYSYHYDPLAN